ncbi:co-chaperone GroES [bacterium]|nr:co-chaperone GroES [bacterium]
MSKKIIKPLEDYVLIKIEKEEKKKTDSGIFLPESASEEKSQIGRVAATGDSDKIKVKKNQKVIFKEFSGTEIEGGKYLMVKNEDILAVVE